MKKLEQIYNPVSDSFLVMAQERGFLGPCYTVFREARSPEFMIEKRIHSGVFGYYSSKKESDAREIFNLRFVEEEKQPMEKLTAFSYNDTRNPSAILGGAEKINNMILRRQFGDAVYAYEICDSPARKLYKFEHEYFGYPSEKPMNKTQALRLLRRVWEDYNLPGEPDLQFYSKPVYQRYLGEKREILGRAYPTRPYKIELKTEDGMVCRRILLHEAAHLVTDWIFGPDIIAHGPHFAMVAAHLYNEYFGIDKKRYFDLANRPEFMLYGPEPRNDPEDILNRVAAYRKDAPAFI